MRKFTSPALAAGRAPSCTACPPSRDLGSALFGGSAHELIEHPVESTEPDRQVALTHLVNTRRLHSSLGYFSPAHYETLAHQNTDNDAA